MYDPSIFVSSICITFRCQPTALLAYGNTLFVIIIINLGQQRGQAGHKQHIPVMGPLLQPSTFSFEPNLCKSVPVPFNYLQIPL